MRLPSPRKLSAWIFDYLIWDTIGSARSGFTGAIWATRKVLMALGASAMLTWREWVEHHPPEIALVVVLHFVFVLALIGTLVYTLQWLGRNQRRPIAGQPKARDEK